MSYFCEWVWLVNRTNMVNYGYFMTEQGDDYTFTGMSILVWKVFFPTKVDS